MANGCVSVGFALTLVLFLCILPGPAASPSRMFRWKISFQAPGFCRDERTVRHLLRIVLELRNRLSLSPSAMALRGGFKNIFGEEQCRNMSRGEADKPRYKEFRTDPVKFVENATALEQVEEEQRKIAATKFEEEMDVRELTKHVLPSDWKTNSRWEKNLRACCMCGMLKNEDMWLDYGCDNCPFLLPPGSKDVDRVHAATTALWKGLWSVCNEPEMLSKSLIIKNKFPTGLLTASKLPAKGVEKLSAHCDSAVKQASGAAGFFRPLDPALQQELKRRGIDPTPLLWNKHSAEHLNYTAEPLSISGDDSDTDLSGFIDDTPRDKYGNPITEAEMEDEDEEEDEGGEDKQAEDEVDQAEGSEDAKY